MSSVYGCPTVSLRDVYNMEDQTVYSDQQECTPPELRRQHDEILRQSIQVSQHYKLDKAEPARNILQGESYSDKLWVQRANTSEGVLGRALACSCYQGRQTSITVRKEKFSRKELPKYPTLESDIGSRSNQDYKFEQNELCRYSYVSRKLDEFYDAKDPSSEYPLPFRLLYGCLAHLLFQYKSFVPLSGLIVISGSTSSGKSNIARGLIDEYLALYSMKHRGKERRPHLLTLEDPIEKLLVDEPGKAVKFGMDYTPRQIGLDVPSLKNGLMDALRQTPAVVYVGETRDKDAWRELIDFAGSGHLVVTTAHAGSLIEAVERMLDAMQARSPADRGEIAQRIRAVIHLQGHQCLTPLPTEAKPIEDGKRCPLRVFRSANEKRTQAPSTKQNVILPALWRQTPAGIAALVADGLASILPNNPRDANASSSLLLRNVSSIGRLWFATRLIDLDEEGKKKAMEINEEELARMNLGAGKLDRNNKMDMKRQALALDLEGI